MFKKKKQRQKKSYLVWHDSRSSVREGGDCLTGSLNLELDSEGSVSRCGVCPTIQDRVWPCERGTWLTGVWRWRWWPVGEGCGWLAFEDEDGGRGMWLTGVWRWRWRWWERDVAGCGPVDEDGLISYRCEIVSCELWVVSCELRERLRRKEKDGWSRSMDARVKKNNVIFFVAIYSTP
jgi:hypothetical protein